MHSPQRFLTFADSPVTVAAGDRVLYCNCTGGNIVLNFPTAVSKAARFFEVVKTDVSANVATITPTGGQTVNGAATFNVTTQYQTVGVVSDNANYTIFYGSSSGSATPTGPAGGDLSGTYPNPKVAAITETSGPTDLVIGTITNGEFLKRVGSTLVSATPPSGGGSSDFEFSFSGTLSIFQNNLIPVKTKRSAVSVDRLDVELQTAPTGQAAIFEFFYGATSLGTVTVAVSTLSGTTSIASVSIPADTRVTVTINQVGSVVVGETASMFVRSV
jgi:hypothetical protein